MGRQLGISEATSKTHLVCVLAKLGVTDRIPFVNPVRRSRRDGDPNRLG